MDHTASTGVASIVLTLEGEHVLTSNIEADRMRDEQTSDIDVVAYAWDESPTATLRELIGDGAFGTDAPDAGGKDMAAEIDELRWVLDDEVIGAYRAVGRDAMEAMGDVAASLAPGMSELEAAGALAEACKRRRMNAPVLLAAADKRISRYRHPVPTGTIVRDRIMLVLCAERGGLYANLTRFVHFEEPDGEMRRRIEASETILRRMREEATHPGRSLAEIFRDCVQFYAEEGFPEEWRRHHQGGLTGYASREIVATPDSTYRIRANQAFAWNPSITGGKAEETFVLTDAGPEILAR